MGLLRSRRKLSNVKLTRRFHVLYMRSWMILSAVYILVLDIMVYSLSEALWVTAAPRGMPLSVERAFQDAQFAASIILPTLFFLIATIFLAVLTAHRVAGPYLAIRRTVRAVKAGDLDCRLQFRDYDRLDPLAQEFNEMLDVLTERRRQREQPPSPALKVMGD